MKRQRERAKLFGVILLLFTGVTFYAQSKISSSHAVDSPATRDHLIQYIRERFGVTDNVKLSVGTFRNSFDPNLYEATLTIDDGKQKQDRVILISKDGHHMIMGDVYNLESDPKQTALRTISTQNQPSQGPANAPVTIVEYADLQCPTCARLHEFFENDLVPKYSGKVRLIFKDFPLIGMHDWAQTASIASQCAYQINPEAFVAYRTLVFKNQSAINATNSRDMLLNLAAQAGIDSLKLASCLDAKATLARVEEDMREGRQLGIASTPTSYVNGKIVLGMPGPDVFYKAVDEAIRSAK